MKRERDVLIISTILLLILITTACTSSSSPVLPPAQTAPVAVSPTPLVKEESINPVPVKPNLPVESLFLEKIDAIPDYSQRDPAYDGLPGKGSQYCGPSSVSNILMWLSDNGFPNLTPHSEDRKKDQFDVIYALGSPKYMDTGLTGSSTSGTNPTKLLSGLKKYIVDKGYAYNRLEYQGWRNVPYEFDTQVKVVDLKWLKQGIQGYGGAWMGIGWYNYNPATDDYSRFDGHWITLVGYGHDGKEANLNSLIVHNSLTSSPNYPKNEYLFPEKINSGILKGNYTGLPCSAVGYSKVKIIGQPKNADFGIFEYAIVLEMKH